MDGRVIEGDASEKVLELKDYTSPDTPILTYWVNRFQKEIEEATYEGSHD